MALVLDGTGSISGLSAGGLPNGSVTADDLASTLNLTGKTVTLPAGVGGKVLQVVQTFKSDTFSSSSSSWTDITGFSVSITPSSSSNKIMLLISVSGGTTSDCEIQAVRTINGSSVSVGSSSSASYNGFGQWSAITGAFPMTLMYLDSPSTTSAVSYKAMVAQVNSGTIYINRRAYANDFGGSSSITVMEIAA